MADDTTTTTTSRSSESEWETDEEEGELQDAVDDVLVSLVAINEDDDDDEEEDDDEDDDEDAGPGAKQGQAGLTTPPRQKIHAPQAPVTPQDRAAKIREDAPVLGRKLSASVEAGELSAQRAVGATRWMDVGIRKLLKIIFREGTIDGEGHSHISFGRLRRKASRVFWGQALVGHLKAAKVKGAVDFAGDRLIQGASDSVDIIGIREDIDDSSPDTYTFGLVRACSFRKSSKGSTRRASKTRLANVTSATSSASSTAAHGDSGGVPLRQTRSSLSTARATALRARKLSNTRGSRLVNAVSTSLGTTGRSGTFSRELLQAGDPTDEETDAIEDVLASLATVIHTEANDDDDDNDTDAGNGNSDDAAGRAVHTFDVLAHTRKPTHAHLFQRKLSVSIRRGELNPNRALQAAAYVDKQLRRLAMCIQESGAPDVNKRTWKIQLKRLADETSGMFGEEQLLGLLHTARDRGIVALPAVELQRPDHDSLSITLLVNDVDDADEDTYTYDHIRMSSVRQRNDSPPTAAAVSLQPLTEEHAHEAGEKRDLLARLDLLDAEAPDDQDDDDDDQDDDDDGDGNGSSLFEGKRFIASGVPLDFDLPDESEQVAALMQDVESLQFSLRLAESSLASTKAALEQQLAAARKETAAAKDECKRLGEELARARKEHAAVLDRIAHQQDKQAEKHAASLTRAKDTTTAAQQKVDTLEQQLVAEQRARHRVETEMEEMRAKHDKERQALKDELSASLRATIRAEVEAQVMAEHAAARAATKAAAAATAAPTTSMTASSAHPATPQQQQRGATVTTNRVVTPAPMNTPSPPTTAEEATTTATAGGHSNSSNPARRAASPVAMTTAKPAAPATPRATAGSALSPAQTSAQKRIAEAKAKAQAVKVKAHRQLTARDVQADEEAVIDVLASMTAINRRDTMKQKAAMQQAARNAAAKTKAAKNSNPTSAPTITTTSADDDTQPKNEAGTTTIVDQSFSIPDTAPVLQRKLSVSVRRGELNPRRALAATRFVDDQIRKLIQNIKSHGQTDKAGKPTITFGKLFETSNNLENLSGTLRTAKKQQIVSYGAEMLLKGLHDGVTITLLRDGLQDSNLDTYTYQQVREASTRRKLTATLKSSIRRSTMNRSNSINLKQLAASARAKRDARIADKQPGNSSGNSGISTNATSSTSSNPNSSAATDAGGRSWQRRGASSSTLLHRGRVLPKQTGSGSRSEPGSAAGSRSQLNPPDPAASDNSNSGGSGEKSDGDEDAVVDVLASMAGLYHKEQVRLSRRGKAPAPAKPASGPDVPDDARINRRRLSTSVRKGELSEKRAQQAARWIDKEIRKLIAAIEKYGKPNGAPDQLEVSFGQLFQETQNEFEALTGTLRTAKKHKVVAFEAETLFQGAHDHVVITLLKHEIPDSTIDTYTYRQVRQCSDRRRLGKAFGSSSLQTIYSALLAFLPGPPSSHHHHHQQQQQQHQQQHHQRQQHQQQQQQPSNPARVVYAIGLYNSQTSKPSLLAMAKDLSSFGFFQRSSDTPFPELKDTLARYQDPEQADNIMKVQKELDETKVILHKVMESVLKRDEKLDDLVAKSDQLSASAKMFYKQARKTNSCCNVT
ncbi:hypothetical protein PTSG_00510 [Salpingoeca rosetta]|uniref:V-SNARE coiled-coil homology domain-containing protein n=1 Tax=Salpingoeca rosetta (strain ATCC 50818 / BSB-021) TaxID=946362 RepID=F2TWN8_SALR5|nr:uncharacterized protein PTSG_00510 [Salpingoeca rosetta]EGD72484.1 hypothetical protein PTSG_00510 [Salpingoeca rosetta]|eukprot:XP_004999053.1 hypothetical protein PTSG_00510 [Salpingoeca rosetta]